MKKFLFSGFIFILTIVFNTIQSQTYQLTGNPVNTTGWDLVPSAIVSGDFIRLTSDQTSQFGAIKLQNTINLKYCDKWRVEFDFRIDGNGTSTYGRGDGLTFWYLSNPPAGFTSGGGLGIPANANGLMVAFDIFNNATEAQMSKVHILYGTNNLPAGNPNIEFNNTVGSTFHSPDLNSTQPFVGAAFKHVEVNGQIDPANINNWIIQIKIDGVAVCNQSFAPSGGAVGMTNGYFGFSSATGAASARQSIKNVKIYIDKVPIFTNTVTPYVCVNPSTGSGFVDLTSFASQFVNNPGNYVITYLTSTGVPISNPANFQYTGPTTVTVIVSDPSSILCDNGDGKIVLNPQSFDAADATLTECNNNNAGVAIFNLGNAAVTALPGVTKHYYPTLATLNAGTNEIMNWYAYPAANGTTVYAKVTTPQGCTDNAMITLNHYSPAVVVNNANLRSCALETNPATATFNLTVASVTQQTGITKKYYPSLTDAANGTNEITNPTSYTAPTGIVYVKVSNNNSCYAIANIGLEVISQVFSAVLLDKVICFENKTTLDAGSGFDGYLWSNGQTTPSINNVGVGTYWVKLKKGDCWTTQTVKIFPSEQPVISHIDISNSSITVNVAGGTPDYQYSLDKIVWQDSNKFENLTRGEYTVYVKDSYRCEPVAVPVTVPNIINVITPNADGLNDYIDYSALSGKTDLVLSIFDRYGTKIHQVDKNNHYKWDGTSNGRKIPTGNYWYSVTWTEDNKNRTPVKFSGWIIVKNRE